MITLFESGTHKNIFFNDLTTGNMVQANQHVIINNNESMVLDPGGHKVHTRLFGLLANMMKANELKHIFFSHQDPDIMPTSKALKMWVKMARKLDIEILAPQHGSIYPNKAMVGKFLDWADNLSCGAEILGDEYKIPA